jgi:hypothetical protein
VKLNKMRPPLTLLIPRTRLLPLKKQRKVFPSSRFLWSLNIPLPVSFLLVKVIRLLPRRGKKNLEKKVDEEEIY